MVAHLKGKKDIYQMPRGKLLLLRRNQQQTKLKLRAIKKDSSLLNNQRELQKKPNNIGVKLCQVVKELMGLKKVDHQKNQ